jgi:hypothetical protein
MGILWDLIQHGQISKQRNRSDTLEQRIAGLERDLAQTQDLLYTLIQRLENHFDEDIDGDGRVG